MLEEKKSGGATTPARPSFRVVLSCGDHEHHDGLITVDVSDEDVNSSSN
jgi:hypothetical protein